MAQPPAVLLIVHSLPPHEFSGTPLIARAQAQRLAERGCRVGVAYAAHVLAWRECQKVQAPDEAFARYELPWTQYVGGDWVVYDAADVHRRREEYRSLFDDVLDDFEPDVVHVVDNVNLPSEWAFVVRDRGVPIVRTVWNLEDLCGLVSPVDPRDPTGPCRNVSPAACAEHVVVDLASSDWTPWSDDALVSWPRRRRSALVDRIEQSLAERHRLTASLFADVYDRVLFPSAAFRDYFTALVEIPPARCSVLAPGVDPTPTATRRRRSSAVTLGFLGGTQVRKGAALVRDIFQRSELLDRDGYTLLLYGDGDASAWTDLLDRNPHVAHRGSFLPEDIGRIAAGFSVGLCPSIFETFHRVTRELLLTGVPVIGSTAFGIPDAVVDGRNGLLVPVGDAEALLAAVLRVVDDHDLVRTLQAGASATVVASVDDETTQLLGIYQELLA